MGMEMLELMLDIENRFGITITNDDDEWWRAETVGQTFEYLLKRLGRAPGPRSCPTARAFYKVRRAAVSRLGLDRHSVSPRTRWDALIPPTGWPRQWQQLAAALGLQLPPTGYSREVREGFQKALGLTLFLTLAFALISLLAPWWYWPVRVALPVTVLSVGVWYTMRLRRRADSVARSFPDGCETVGDLARQFLPRLVPDWEADAALGKEQAEVWGELRSVVSRVCGVEPARITPHSRYLQDLGAG